jgi:hypothetical protein
MRRLRNDAEYPPTDGPGLTSADVTDDLKNSRALTDLAERVLNQCRRSE